MALKKYFQALNFPSNYTIKVTVIANNHINAFALPGGALVIFTGILDKIETHEELAALISHELTHIEKKHSTKALCKNLSNYMFISIITRYVGGISSVMIENATCSTI